MAATVSINGYDAVFMDSVMPVMDGPTAVKDIRALGFKNRIFGVTGNAFESQISEFMGCAVDKVFTKPLDTKAFARAIESLQASEVDSVARDEACDRSNTAFPSRDVSLDKIESGLARMI